MILPCLLDNLRILLRHSSIAIGLVLLVLLAPSPVGAGEQIDRLREGAVLKARNGDIPTGISILQQALEKYPDNISLRSDLIVLYGWNGQPDKALELYRQRPIDLYPEYVQLAAIAGYRDMGRSGAAIEITDFLLKQRPEDTAVLLRKCQLLVDTGRYEEARIIIQRLADSGLAGEDLYRVAGYYHRAQRNHLQALRQYQHILQKNPGDSEALHESVMSLLHLGAPFAASQYTANKAIFSIAELADILRSKAALLLRWSSHASSGEDESILYACRAVLLQIQAMSMIDDADRYRELKRSIEYDMVVGLRDLRLYQSSFSLYERLVVEAAVPGYVSLAAADALLSLRKPAEAALMLEEILAEDPNNLEAKQTLFYAYVESEKFESAYELIDIELMATPRFKTFLNSNEQYPNDEYLDLVILAAQGRLYGDQLAESWQRIEALKDMAPANNRLLGVAGETALARGWPRRAHGLFSNAILLNPDDSGAIAGMGQSLISLRKYSQAEEILESLREKSPADFTTRRLAKDLYWARRPDVWADLELSYSQGPEQSGDGITATGEFISAPLNDFLYLSMQGRYAWSEIPEGEETFTRYGGGVEASGETLNLLALIHHNRSSVEETGGLLRGSWTPDDYWTLTLQGERFSQATPLRALYYGIREDMVNGVISYRWHEGESMTVRLNSGWFTDDNHRLEGGLQYRQRVVDVPRFDLEAGVELYSTANTRDDAPYYNPEADLHLKGTLLAEHILCRFYEKSVVQRLFGGIGVYGQKGYETGMTGSIRYELQYRFDPVLEATLGGELGRNRYDGEGEPYYKFNFMIHAKF